MRNWLKTEYQDGFANIESCLRQHTSFCLYTDFDAIMETNKVLVECCECGESYKVDYRSVASHMFCQKCIDAGIVPNKENLSKLKLRLQGIQEKLLNLENYERT